MIKITEFLHDVKKNISKNYIYYLKNYKFKFVWYMREITFYFVGSSGAY